MQLSCYIDYSERVDNIYYFSFCCAFLSHCAKEMIYKVRRGYSITPETYISYNILLRLCLYVCGYANFDVI